MSIPEDLVDEILCRVPAINLKGLRTTCQKWNRLYKDSWFARKHLAKSPKQLFPITVKMNYRIAPISITVTHKLFRSVTVPCVGLKPHLTLNDPKNPGFEFDIFKVFHCDGFLLCTSEDESRLVVWNPLTGETKWIVHTVDAMKLGRTFVLGYCNSSKSYKILSFDNSRKSESEIYDLRSNSWRVLDYDISPGWLLTYSYHYVSLKGNAYMFATEQGKTQTNLSLMKFDFTTEKCLPVPLPVKRLGSYESASLSVVGGEKISVLLKHKIQSKTEVWVSNKVVSSWSKILELDLDLSIDLQIMLESSFLLDEEKKVLVVCTRQVEDENAFVDTIAVVEDEDKVTLVEFGRGTGDEAWPEIYNYVPSLVRIECAGCKRKTM